MKSLPEPAREPIPEPPPQLGDGFSPPPGEPDVQAGRSLADPAEPPHPAPWSKSDF